MTAVLDETSTSLRERAVAAWHEERDHQRSKTITAAKLVAGRFGIGLDNVSEWDDNERPIWDIAEVGVEATWIEYQRRDKTTDRAFWIVDRCANCNTHTPVLRFTSLAEFGRAIERVSNDDVPEWECSKCNPAAEEPAA